MKRESAIRFLLLVAMWAVPVALVFLSPAESFAQCALCKTAMANSSGAVARSLNLGILVLIVPPVAIFCAIFATAYRYRKPHS